MTGPYDRINVGNGQVLNRRSLALHNQAITVFHVLGGKSTPRIALCRPYRQPAVPAFGEPAARPAGKRIGARRAGSRPCRKERHRGPHFGASGFPAHAAGKLPPEADGGSARPPRTLGERRRRVPGALCARAAPDRSARRAGGRWRKAISWESRIPLPLVPAQAGTQLKHLFKISKVRLDSRLRGKERFEPACLKAATPGVICRA